MSGTRFVDDHLEVGSERIDIEPSQPVVRSQFHDEDRNGLVVKPFNATNTAGRGSSAFTAIDDSQPQSNRVELSLSYNFV